MPTIEEFFDAIDNLFGFQTLETNFGIIIGKEEKLCYAKIGEFLSAPDEVYEIMRVIAEYMTMMFKDGPEQFSHQPESGFVERNFLHAGKVALDVKTKETERNQALLKYGNKAVPQKLQNPNAKVKEAIDLTHMVGHHHLNATKGLFYESSGLVVRRFSFRKLLIALEKEFLGFTDHGLILTEDVTIAKYLRSCEVWKDSIGIQHGEYTHRLQWLAIAIKFKWDKSLLATLYKGSSATLKKAAYECFGAASLPDFLIKRDQQKLDVPVNVWEFLFDSREMRGQELPCWPKDMGKIEVNKYEAYRFSHRSKNSCQSPAFLNKALSTNAGFGILHAYLSASAIKLLDVGNLKSISLASYQKGRQELKKQKLILNQFETPLSPTITLTPPPSNLNSTNDGKNENT